MKEFNYQDYLKYQKLKAKENNSLYELREPEEKYHVHQPHDKIFKTVLNEKREMVELINRVLELKTKLKEEEIEIFNNEHISHMFEGSVSDIVYKMKEKEIFFLIEHQQKIDYDMPKRILEYEVEIIKQATRGKKMTKQEHKLPRVIPIVIYTGSGKWNVEKYIEECQEILSKADCVRLGEYYVLDVNNYTKEELEKDNLFLSKMLLLEKLKTGEEIYHMLNTAIEKENDERNKAILKRIIAFILDEKLSLENREKLLKKLEGGKKDMVLEVIRKENERLIKKGKVEGKIEGEIEILKRAVKNMLQFGEDEEKIMKYIGINKEELGRIKRMLKTII